MLVCHSGITHKSFSDESLLGQLSLHGIFINFSAVDWLAALSGLPLYRVLFRSHQLLMADLLGPNRGSAVCLQDEEPVLKRVNTLQWISHAALAFWWMPHTNCPPTLPFFCSHIHCSLPTSLTAIYTFEMPLSLFEPLCHSAHPYHPTLLCST